MYCHKVWKTELNNENSWHLKDAKTVFYHSSKNVSDDGIVHIVILTLLGAVLVFRRNLSTSSLIEFAPQHRMTGIWFYVDGILLCLMPASASVITVVQQKISCVIVTSPNLVHFPNQMQLQFARIETMLLASLNCSSEFNGMFFFGMFNVIDVQMALTNRPIRWLDVAEIATLSVVIKLPFI